MKKLYSLLVALAAIMFTSCNNYVEEIVESGDDLVTLDFRIVGDGNSFGYATRASLADAFTMLEVALYKKDSEGVYTKYMEVDQSLATTNFGSVSMRNVKSGTYTLLAVGHDASVHPDIDDPTDIVFANYPNAFIYSSEIEVNKTSARFDVPMKHASTRVNIKISGYIPDDAKSLKVDMEGISNNLNGVTGFARSTTNRTAIIPIAESSKVNGFIDLNTYFFMTKSEYTRDNSPVNFTFTGLDANNNEITTKRFEKIPLAIGSCTTFSGVFFDFFSSSFNITVDDVWGTNETIEF